jgi:hypothetical protein
VPGGKGPQVPLEVLIGLVLSVDRKMQLVPPKCSQSEDRQSSLALMELFRDYDNAAVAFQKEWRPASEFIPLAWSVRIEPDVSGKLRHHPAM